jgi:hypothetical protein
MNYSGFLIRNHGNKRELSETFKEEKKIYHYPGLQYLVKYSIISKGKARHGVHPVILALRRQRKEDCEFKASLGYITRYCFKIKQNSRCKGVPKQKLGDLIAFPADLLCKLLRQSQMESDWILSPQKETRQN